MKTLLAFSMVLIGASCGSSTPAASPADPGERASTRNARAEHDGVVAPTDAEPPPPLPGPLAQLDTPCEPAAETVEGNRPSAGERCGADGRLAVVSMPLDVYGWNAPAPFTGPSCAVDVQQGVLRFVAHGRWLWIRFPTCPQCARQMGLAYVLAPAQIEAATLAALQVEMGLAEHPALRTTEAWLEALRALPGAQCEP